MQSNYMFILYYNFVSFQVILWYFYITCVYFHVGWKPGKMQGIETEMSLEEARVEL